jgi:hypothetical protein
MNSDTTEETRVERRAYEFKTTKVGKTNTNDLRNSKKFMEDEKSIITKNYSKDTDILQKRESGKNFDKFDLYFNENNADELKLRPNKKHSLKNMQQESPEAISKHRGSKLEEDEYLLLKSMSIELENTQTKARAGSILKMLESNIDNIRRKTMDY